MPAPTVSTVNVVAKLLPPNKPEPMVNVLPTVYPEPELLILNAVIAPAPFTVAFTVADDPEPPVTATPV